MKRIRTFFFPGNSLGERPSVPAALLSLAGLLLLSCSSAPPAVVAPAALREGCELVDASSPQKPGWYDTTPADEGGVSHHVGISRKFASEQDALENAKRSAIKGFVESCGVRVEYFDSFLKTSQGQSTAGAIVEEISGSSGGRQSSRGYVSGIRAPKRYAERHRCASQGVTEHSYKTAVLVTVPAGECERVKAWMEGEKRRLGEDLDKLIATAASQAGERDFRSARQTLEEAEARLKGSSFDRADFSYRHATIGTRQVAYFRGMLHKGIDAAVAKAHRSAATGDPVAAFHSLKKVAVATGKRKMPGGLRAELMEKIADAERALVSGISLQPVGPTQVASRDGKPVRLELEVRYRDPAAGEPVAVVDFPIVFVAPSQKRGASTDSGGRVSYRYPPGSGAESVEIVAMVNPLPAERHLSREALLALSGKSVRYRVDIRRRGVDILLDQLTPLPPPAFPLSVSATLVETDEGPVLSIAAACGVRCHLKVFGIGSDGTVAVWEDSGDRRLIKNRPQTIRIADLKRGKHHILVVAATEALPHRFEINRTMGRETFLSLYRDFSKGPGRLSELLKMVEIK